MKKTAKPTTRTPEIGIFVKHKINIDQNTQVTTSQDIEKVFRSIGNFNKQIDYKEFLYVAYLNAANKILSVLCISEGTDVSTVCDIKQIIQGAVLQNAKAVILCHNHPSGKLIPSKKDYEMTKKVFEVLKIMNITLLDHLILTVDSYYSFADNEMLDF